MNSELKECPFCGKDTFQIDAKNPAIGKCLEENRTYMLRVPGGMPPSFYDFLIEVEELAVDFQLPHPELQDMTTRDVASILRTVKEMARNRCAA